MNRIGGYRLPLLLLLLVCISGLSCEHDDTVPVTSTPDIDTTGYVYRVPESTDDGWETIHLDGVGIDHSLIEQMMDCNLASAMPDLHSIIIVRDGKLVFEEYFGDWDRYDLHMLMSCTKSFTSALVGIAIDEGYLDNVDAGVYNFFPEYDTLRTAAKDSIKLKHAMTMTGGLEWDQTSYSYSDKRNSLYQLLHCECNWLEYILALDAVHAAGSVFAYSDGMAILTGEIVSRATGMPLSLWADERLLKPLGIHYRSWRHGSGDIINSGYGLYLRPRDMAKFGQLYLDGGIWDGRQIVTNEWVEKSTSEIFQLYSTLHYGYMWWRLRYCLDDGRCFQTIAAAGNYGQYILIFPELEEVVVFTMARPSGQGDAEARWALVNYILPASVSRQN